MKLKRMHGVLMVAGVVASLVVVLGAWHTQDDLTVDQPKVEPGATTPHSDEPQVAMQAPESRPPCDAVSPFAAANVACSADEPTLQADATLAASGSTAEESVIGPVPDFVKVKVVGSLGGGVAAALLKAAGRDLAVTSDSHDSVLVDSSTTPDVEVAATIQQALSRGQYIIVDGSDSLESSTKLNRIMGELNLLSMNGVTAYGLSKGTDGKFNITPLQSLADEKGARSINQIHNVLGIKKS